MVRYEMSAAEYRGEGREASWRLSVKGAAAALGWVVLAEIPDKAYAELAKLSKRKDPRTGKWTKFHNPGMIPVYDALRGQPDLLLGHVVYGIAIAVELKIPGKEAMDHQNEKLEKYHDCGIDAYVWHTGNEEAFEVLKYPFLPHRTFWDGSKADAEGRR